jgi:phosphoribosylformylglycinamidine synthase
VSFYNEGPAAAVYPTPVIGMIGLIDDAGRAVCSHFREHGAAVVLLGATKGQIGGSEYLALIHNTVAGEPPDLDLELEKRVHLTCLQAVQEGLVYAAHDCSEGGLAVALAECCLGTGEEMIGAEITLPDNGIRPDMLCFGEDQSRIILAVAAAAVPGVMEIARRHSVPAATIGHTGGNRLRINTWIDISCGEVERLYESAIPGRMTASST